MKHKAWLVLVAMCGLVAASVGISINTSGIFYSVVANSLHIYRGSFAFHMTIFSLVTAITALFVPKLLQKVNYKLLLLIGILIATASTAMMAMARQVWQFNLLGGIRGFSTGLFSIVTVTMVINNWFKSKNGLATSLALAFSGIMGAALSPVFALIIQKSSWQITYLVEAGMILLLCLPALILPYKFNPLDEGLQAYGAVEGKTEKTNRSEKTALGWGLTMLIVFAFLVSFTSSMTQHLPGYASSIGYSAELGASLLSLGMVGNILSKLLVGSLSDYLGIAKSTLILIALNLVACGLLLLASSSSILLVGSFLFGSCYGLGAVSSPLLTRMAFGDQNYGKTFPIVSFTGNIGASLAFSSIGYIYDFSSSYRPAFLIIVLMLVVSAVNVVLLDRKGSSR